MNYQYKLIVSSQTTYKEFEIPDDMERVCLGTTSSCEFRLDPDLFFEDIEIILERKNKWVLNCQDNLYINRGDVRKLFFTELIHGDQFRVCYSSSGEAAFDIRFLIDFDAKGHRYNLRFDISSISELAIGDGGDAQIELLSDFGKKTRVTLKRTRQGIVLSDKYSLYGAYVNGKRIEKDTVLHESDFISVADFSAYYKDDQLYFSEENIRLNGVSDKVVCTDDQSGYPLFVRNTRIKSNFDESPIKVLDPENVPAKPELNIVMSLLPAIAMFALVVVLRGVLNTTGGTFVIFSICTMGLGVITSVMSIFSKKRRYKRDCEDRRKTYTEYIEYKRKEIETARQEECQLMRERYYSTAEDLAHIENFSPVLFDRIPGDEDYLHVYLGVGSTKSRRPIEFKTQEKLKMGDDLCQLPGELSREYERIGEAPVVIELKDANAVGIVGAYADLYEVFKCMLIDIVSRQYQGDINIYTLLKEGSEKEYDWLRLLPHLQSDGSHRNIVVDNESKNNVFESLYKELTFRSETNVSSAYNIVLIMDEWGIKSHPISRFIENAGDLNTVFVFFEPKIELLPLHCKTIVSLSGRNQAEVYEAGDRTDIRKCVYTNVPDERMARAVRMLAPVYCEEISLESALRKSISMFELLGIYNVNDLNLKERWESSRICDSMAAPLGINAKDEVVCLDLHEKYHGPHGLVAGTTGSGKSEILQTYILGVATLFHPYEVGFLIIDFKGGGMVNQFKNLPHLMGAITNIDGKAIDRSLKSIKAELLKRQELFADMEVNSIEKYISAYKAGKTKIPLPHLIIIVDEFAELKAEQPEFMKELISTARIGRSLGVHLILATQKPAGQVNDQIWSNSRFKLCLKVQTQEDSNEVLKSPLAAEIREPGRAYLQVGNNEMFELLQSGFSGAPEKIDGDISKNIDIWSVDFAGRRELLYQRKAKKNQGGRTQLEAIVDHVNRYFTEAGHDMLPQICQPDLPEIINCEAEGLSGNAEISVPIGIYDDPDHQVQEKAVAALGLSNTLIIGSSQYGKTNLLEVMIKNLAGTYKPSEVNIYIMDFGSMVLKNFEKLAHVGGVVLPQDDEKVKNLFKFLSDQINWRKEKMLKAGVSSFLSYKEAGFQDIPQIIVFIDNMTVLKELYLQDSDVLLNLCREGIATGISFVVTNTQVNGLGYKYMSNFAARIAFTCNEISEYASVFGSCRTQPDDVQGRCLIEIEKTIYECQTYLAFEGEREVERIRRMQEYVDLINSTSGGQRAKRIPEIPDLLTEAYIEENYDSGDGRKVIIGLDYSSVDPVVLNLQKPNLLALSGPDESGKSNFIRYFVDSLIKKEQEMDIYIFDDYRRKLSSLCRYPEVSLYEIQPHKYQELFAAIEMKLQGAYQKLVADEGAPDEMQMIILNNPDVIADISNDKPTLEIIKNIINKYKMLNTYILLGCVPNTQIVYGAPELYKMAKDTRNIIYFDNLDVCRLIDVPAMVVRNNRKKIGIGDAYYVHDTDFYKIKTPLAEG